jgi:tetratricopeptide (TPR) repeat protein
MKRAILPLLPLVFSSIASAEQHWLKATSANFEVYTTAGEKKAREVILYFEQVRSLFERESHPVRSAAGRVRIVVFQSPREYKPYQMYDRPAYAAGSHDHDEIVLGNLSADYYTIAVHEYVHIMLRPIRNVPLWLNEGMAEFYSNLHPMGKKVSVGEPLPGRVSLLQANQWLDLETLCAVDYKSPYYTTDHSKVSVFYAESWALTHMLALSGSYRPRFFEFERLIFAGTEPAEAFRNAFGKPMREVLADLHRYIQQGTLPGRLLDVTLDKSAEDPEIKPVTPFESGLVLANILADLNKVTEARQAYLQLAAENPASPEVAEALGYLAWQRGDQNEARAHFAKAVELGSKNARMYYEYSAMAGQAEPIESRIKLLRKAVDLDPEFYDARLHLGFQLMSESDYAGALAQFAHLKKVEPEHAFAFFQAVAYAAYRTGDKEGARANAKRAAECAQGPAEKAAVEQLLAEVDRHPGERLRTMTMTPAPERKPEEESAPQPVPQPARDQTTLPQPPKRIALSAVEGTLDRIDCLGTTARIRMTAAGRPVLLLIDKPNGIEVRGQAGSFTMTCGPQKARRAVRVEYEPKVNDELGTIGLVRVLEMK